MKCQTQRRTLVLCIAHVRGTANIVPLTVERSLSSRVCFMSPGTVGFAIRRLLARRTAIGRDCDGSDDRDPAQIKARSVERGRGTKWSRLFF